MQKMFLSAELRTNIFDSSGKDNLNTSLARGHERLPTNSKARTTGGNRFLFNAKIMIKRR